jgi:hypothetical protein
VAASRTRPADKAIARLPIAREGDTRANLLCRHPSEIGVHRPARAFFRPAPGRFPPRDMFENPSIFSKIVSRAEQEIYGVWTIEETSKFGP